MFYAFDGSHRDGDAFARWRDAWAARLCFDTPCLRCLWVESEIEMKAEVILFASMMLGSEGGREGGRERCRAVFVACLIEVSILDLEVILFIPTLAFTILQPVL